MISTKALKDGWEPQQLLHSMAVKVIVCTGKHPGHCRLEKTFQTTSGWESYSDYAVLYNAHLNDLIQALEVLVIACEDHPARM